MILYQMLRMSFAGQENGLDVSLVWLMPALLLPCAAAYRLARFNIDESQSYGFKGVPAPAGGLFIASLPLISWYTTSPVVGEALTNKWVLYCLILVVGWLMVSKLPLMALKFKDYSVKGNLPKITLLLLAVIAVIFLRWLAVPVIFLLYIIVSLVTEKKNYTGA